MENKGACGFNSNLINDGHVRSKVSSEVKQGYGYVKQHEPMDKTPSEVLVGPKVNSANNGNTIATPYSITLSDDELFEAANMSKQRDSYVSETDSDTESGGTTLDVANQHENRDGKLQAYQPPSQPGITRSFGRTASFQRPRRSKRRQVESRIGTA